MGFFPEEVRALDPAGKGHVGWYLDREDLGLITSGNSELVLQFWRIFSGCKWNWYVVYILCGTVMVLWFVVIVCYLGQVLFKGYMAATINEIGDERRTKHKVRWTSPPRRESILLSR